jgi:leader peptidase (prepilin peptidase)/N-methyltransferase
VDLIPYLSWLRLHGKCRYCKQSFGAFYPLIELAALVIALWAATVTGGIVFAASCTLGWTLLALAISDWQTFLLPDPLVLFLLVAGFGATVLLSPAQFFQHLIGAFAGYIAFATLSWAYRRLRGRNGLGLGDAKLLAALGAWLSWSALPSVVFLAALAGLAMILARSLLGSRTILTDRISFGTFLAGAGWLVWLYGPLALG